MSSVRREQSRFWLLTVLICTFFQTVVTVNLENCEVDESSNFTKVYDRILPISEPELLCHIYPQVGGKAIQTLFVLNCTSVHKRYDLYDEGTTEFYKSSPNKFWKRIYIETETEVIQVDDFLEPVSQGFALPPGDNVTVKLVVTNCNNVIIDQLFMMQVDTYDLGTLSMTQLDSFLASGHVSVVFSTVCVMRNQLTELAKFNQMKVRLLAELNKLQPNTSRELTTVLTTLNILSKDTTWMDDLIKKNAVVNLYFKLTDKYEVLTEEIPVDERTFMTGIILDGVTSLLDNFIEHHGNRNQSGNSFGMSNITKKLMNFIDEAIDVSLKNFSVSESPEVLYLSNTTVLLAQKTNGSSLAGTKFVVQSEHPGSSDTFFEFPNIKGIDDGVNIRMIYQRKNPFIWVKDAFEITSPVLTVTIKNSTGQELSLKDLYDPVKIVMPRLDFVHEYDVIHFNIAYTKTNGSYQLNEHQMMYMVITLEKGETKVLDLKLPETISNVLIFGQPFDQPPVETVLEQGFLFPKDWAKMQKFYGSFPNDTNFESIANNLSDHRLYIVSDENLLQGKVTYDVYFGIMMDYINGTNDELKALDVNCSSVEKGTCDGKFNIEIEAQLSSFYCLYWDEVETNWSGRGCEACEVLLFPRQQSLDCLNHSQMTVFRPFQLESNGRQQFEKRYSTEQDKLDSRIGMSGMFLENIVEIEDITYPVSGSNQLQCRCYHLSSFSTKYSSKDLFVKPSGISLDDINLFSTFFDNPIVVTAVVMVWVTYFFLIHWARRLDKKDLEQIGVLKCGDNCPSENYLYLVCVMTGWWTQAGTTANVYLNITGMTGSSSKKCLSTNARLCFQSGSEDWFVFTTEKCLGSLETVTIWHDNRGTSPHWYLNQLIVKDMQTGTAWNFIYNDWLAADRGHLKQTTTTIQAVTDEEMKFKRRYNFMIISSRTLREGHLWISIISKPPQNTFTRVQRMTCGLSLILTTMLTNIMFYGFPSDEHNGQILADGFSFSLRQFIIGMQSSLIMLPLNLFIMQLFIRIKPKPKTERKLTVDEEEKIDKGLSYEEKHSKFYSQLYKSGIFSRNKIFKKVLSHSERDVSATDENGDKIVAKYLNTMTQMMLYKALKGRSLNEDEDSSVVDSSLTTIVDSSVTTIPSQLIIDIPSNVWGIDLNVNMSASGGKKRQENIRYSTKPGHSIKRESVVQKKGVKKILPWWFIYVSWTIVMALCLISSFFVMLYGLKYGYARSMEWMVSFITGFCQGVCLEQPLKVIAVAVIVVLLLHKKAEIEEYGPDVELAEDEEYLSEVKIHEYRHQPFVAPISQSLMEKIKERLKWEWLMNITIRDMVLYVLYLTVVLIMVHGHNNHHVNYQNSQTVYQLLVEPRDGMSLSQVTNPEEFYTYMLETFIPVTESMSETERPEVSPTSNHYLLGFYRMRQLRAETADCSINLPRKIARRCLDAYWMSREDTQSYGVSWASVAYQNMSKGAWKYHDSSDLQTLPYPGIYATYSGGGYVKILKANAADDVKDLHKKGWIDDKTRAVFLECTLYNPNLDIYTLVILLFEMTPVGQMYPKPEILSTSLHHYSSDFQKVVAVCEGLFVCFNLLFIMTEYKKFRKLGKQAYFSEKWNFVELLLIMLSIVILGLFIKRIITVSYILDDYTENHDKRFINFFKAFYWNYILEYIMAFLVAIAIIKSIKLFRLNARTKLINMTLVKVKFELLGFLFMYMIFLIAYSNCGNLMLGRLMSAYKNVQHSLYSNTLIMFRSEIGLEMKDASRIFGPIYMISFVLFMNYILAQLCVTILNAGRIITKFEQTGKNKYELIDYMTAKLKMLIARK